MLKKPDFAVPSLPRYIELKYFSGDSPPIVFNNLRDNKVQVVQQDTDGQCKWVCKDKRATINVLVDAGVEDLENQYDADTVVQRKPWVDKYLPTMDESVLPAYTSRWSRTWRRSFGPIAPTVLQRKDR